MESPPDTQPSYFHRPYQLGRAGGGIGVGVLVKPALDWLTEATTRSSEAEVVKWVEQIQDDAIKHGMRIAANIVMEERHKSYTEDRNPLSLLVDLQKSIMQSANNYHAK